MSTPLKRVRVSSYVGTMGVIGIFAVLVLAWPSVSLAAPVTFGFDYIPSEDSLTLTDAGIGEAQLFMDIDDAGSDTILITLRNVGPLPSVIAGIYFEADPFLGPSAHMNFPPEIDFALDTIPPVLPGGTVISFVVSFGFMAVPDSPTTGVGPGEELGISFPLLAGGTLSDVVGELNDGSLRIGLHVIAFEDAGSESFVNVPEPATLILLGLGSIALVRRRRNS